jgi:hypothetical protein
MRSITCLIALLWVTTASAALDSTGAFSASFSEPIRISGFGLDRQRIARLTASDRANLLAARFALGEFFRRLQNPAADLKELTTVGYAHRFRDELDMRKTLIDPETSILEIGITDFRLRQNKSSVELRFYALVSSEGTLVANEGSADLIGEAGAWRIDKVKIGEQ